MNLLTFYCWLDAYKQAAHRRASTYSRYMRDFISVSTKIKQDYGLNVLSDDGDLGDMNAVYESERIMIAWLEDYLLHISPSDRPLFMDNILGRCSPLFDLAYRAKNRYLHAEKKSDEEMWLHFNYVLCSDIAVLCVRYSMTPKTVHVHCIPKDVSREEVRRIGIGHFGKDVDVREFIGIYLFTDTRLNQSQEQSINVKENSIRISYRRAAVMALLDKIPALRNVDKTKKAEFTEAVIGGNVAISGKNTPAYQPFTPNAKAEAAKLLKKIGL